MNKNSLASQRRSKDLLSLLFVVISIAYVFPVFMVVVNILRLSGMAKKHLTRL